MEIANLPEICTPEQVAEYLSVARSTIYAWCASGELPSIKIRKVLRIRKAALLEWIAEHERASCSSQV
ncbi:helix-turn-helix domain-containing protein [Paenibacillus sp. FSL L8-0708]|uniref:helix-turn-helix domain-containing protein n=1 Tax=Paenibacillus sp. FSL L8-0708 TaxID=2975311 RepID=UPI0030F95614